MMTGTTADFEPDKIPLSDRRNVNELQVADMLITPDQVDKRRVGYLGMLSMPLAIRQGDIDPDIPAVLVHSEDDPLFPCLNVDTLSELMPQSAVHLYRDRGHLGTMGIPTAIALRLAVDRAA